MKKIQKDKSKSTRTLEIISLVVAILCLTIGFLALSSQIKINSQAIVNQNKLNFKIVFSSDDYRESTDIIVPITNNSDITASNGIINNSKSPIITNLGANFTFPGQKVTYKFYVFNAGKHTGYLNDIIYEDIGRSNTSKLCISQNGTINDEIRKACEDIKISVKVGDITTSKSLYYINERSLRPRNAQPIEITIEYLNGGNISTIPFDVLLGDIKLYYSMFDNESSYLS